MAGDEQAPADSRGDAVGEREAGGGTDQTHHECPAHPEDQGERRLAKLAANDNLACPRVCRPSRAPPSIPVATSCPPTGTSTSRAPDHVSPSIARPQASGIRT